MYLFKSIQQQSYFYSFEKSSGRSMYMFGEIPSLKKDPAYLFSKNSSDFYDASRSLWLLLKLVSKSKQCEHQNIFITILARLKNYNNHLHTFTNEFNPSATAIAPVVADTYAVAICLSKKCIS